MVESVLCRCREKHKKFLCGTGKAAEMVELARAHECDVIVFDNGLAPSQQREWEKLADLCVIDREEVILDIFAKRAQTREARLQVDLARMQYALPRLARMWGHLDREAGGSGGGAGGGASRGMGEKQIEVDRRLAHLTSTAPSANSRSSASSARPSARSARNSTRPTPPSSATPTPANPPCSTSSAAPT